MPEPKKVAASHQARAVLSIALLVSFASATISPAPLTVAASALCLALIIWLLWSRNEVPILLLPALFQWSEVATPSLSTIWKQVPLNQLFQNNADFDFATLYALAAIGILAVALRLGSGRSKYPGFAERLRVEATVWRYRDVALIAFSAIGAGYLAASISGFAGSARELFNQISNIKYVGLFVLSYWCLVRRSRMLVLAAVIAFEVVFGMTGFFAEFKDSILTFLIAALAARPKLRPADMAIVTSAGILLFGIAIFWSEVKPSYRLFVNQGSGEQVVLEPLNQRIEFLANAAGAMDAAQFSDGFDKLVARHGYIEYLALTMQSVPAVIPHENGRLTLGLLEHVTVPRFLFPDKPVLPNDTEITKRYTGVHLSINSATSISIGYLGELYVDFGLLGSLLAVAAIGGVTGFAYRMLRDHSNGPLLVVAGLCLIIALPLAYFGQAYVKTMGGWVASVIVAFAGQRFWLPRVRVSRERRPTHHTSAGLSKGAVAEC